MHPLLIMQIRAAGLAQTELEPLICGIVELDTVRSLGRFRYGQSNQMYKVRRIINQVWELVEQWPHYFAKYYED